MYYEDKYLQHTRRSTRTVELRTSTASSSELPFGFNYIWFTKKTRYPWLKEDPRTQEMLEDAREKYELNKAKYGNLDFLNL